MTRPGPEWLMANAGEDNVVILDIRDDIEGTDLGSAPYVEGAVVAPHASAGCRTRIDGVPGMLPPVEAVAGLIGSLGIDNDGHLADDLAFPQHRGLIIQQKQYPIRGTLG